MGCFGGFLDTSTDYSIKYGVVKDSDNRYKGFKDDCNDKLPTQYIVDSYTINLKSD